MLSPNSSWLTPELWGEKVSQNPCLLAGDALLALLSWLLVPTGSSCQRNSAASLNMGQKS